MRRKLLVILLITVVVSAFGIVTGDSRRPGNVRGESSSTLQPQAAGLINGEVTPELIPDHVAYGLVFRLLSDRNTDEEKTRARSYLRMVFGCDDCSERERLVSEKHINAFLAVAHAFEERVGVLDRRAQEIWQVNPSPEVLAELNVLQQQKEIIVAELISSLPARLGPNGARRLHQHITDRVKRKTKIGPPHIHN
jgi:hypothetical protein